MVGPCAISTRSTRIVPVPRQMWPGGQTTRRAEDGSAERLRMGVFLARQISLNLPVALMTILTGQLADETDAERFDTEAEARRTSFTRFRLPLSRGLVVRHSCPTRQVDGQTETIPFKEAQSATVGSIEASASLLARVGVVGPTRAR